MFGKKKHMSVINTKRSLCIYKKITFELQINLTSNSKTCLSYRSLNSLHLKKKNPTKITPVCFETGCFKITFGCVPLSRHAKLKESNNNNIFIIRKKSW